MTLEEANSVVEEAQGFLSGASNTRDEKGAQQLQARAYVTVLGALLREIVGLRADLRDRGS